MKATKPLLKEREIAKTCSDFLELDSWRPIKMEPISRREWGKGTGEAGQPDYLYIRYRYRSVAVMGHRFGCPCCHGPYTRMADVDVLWVEWKSPTGKPKPHQLAWHRAERARGALTLIAGVDFPATFEGFRDFYQKSGLARRVK